MGILTFGEEGGGKIPRKAETNFYKLYRPNLFIVVGVLPSHFDNTMKIEWKSSFEMVLYSLLVGGRGWLGARFT